MGHSNIVCAVGLIAVLGRGFVINLALVKNSYNKAFKRDSPTLGTFGLVRFSVYGGLFKFSVNVGLTP